MLLTYHLTYHTHEEESPKSLDYLGFFLSEIKKLREYLKMLVVWQGYIWFSKVIYSGVGARDF